MHGCIVTKTVQAANRQLCGRTSLKFKYLRTEATSYRNILGKTQEQNTKATQVGDYLKGTVCRNIYVHDNEKKRFIKVWQDRS